MQIHNPNCANTFTVLSYDIPFATSLSKIP